MKTRFLALGLIVFSSLAILAEPAPLTESVFTEIIKEVNVVASSTKAATPARTNELFKAPDLVRTGPESRVELTAADQTITRIGANTIFTFETGGRNIYLEKGSILFHSPAGKGGGAIKHGGAAAAVLGTTIICAILPDGAFKILVLEGRALVTRRDGSEITLHAGQMVIIPADGNSFGAVQTFNIQQLVSRLLLIQGFSNALSSMPLINDAIQQQVAEFGLGGGGALADLLAVAEGLDVFGVTGPSPPPFEPIIFTDLRNQFISPTKP
jgi:hypothetical protein